MKIFLQTYTYYLKLEAMEKLENCVGSIICARCVKPRRQK